MEFASIQLHGGEPVYAQLVAHVKRSILSGAAEDGEALPSRRELAALLGINPNTVQKAYRQLEEEGILVTPRNAASTLRINRALHARLEQELMHAFIRAFVETAQANHLSYKRTIELISQYWEETV